MRSWLSTIAMSASAAAAMSSPVVVRQVLQNNLPHLQVQLLQNGLERVITEADSLESELAAKITEGFRMRRISRLLRLLLDLSQPTQGGLALLKLIEVVGDMSDGVDQYDKPCQVAAQTGNVEITALNPCGTHCKNGEQPHHLNDADHWMLESHQAVGAVTGSAVLVDFRFKS